MIITTFSNGFLMALADWAVLCNEWKAADQIDAILVERGFLVPVSF